MHSEKQREANFKIPIKFDRDPISLREKPSLSLGEMKNYFPGKVLGSILCLIFTQWKKNTIFRVNTHWDQQSFILN